MEWLTTQKKYEKFCQIMDSILHGKARATMLYGITKLQKELPLWTVKLRVVIQQMKC